MKLLFKVLKNMRYFMLVSYFLFLGPLFAQNEEIQVPLSVIDSAPIYIGCEEKTDLELKRCFYQQIEKHVKKGIYYTENNRNKTSIYRVMSHFYIDSKGHIKNVKTRSGLKSLEIIVSNRIKELPQFTPGKQRGENVTTTLTIPFTFRLPHEIITEEEKKMEKKLNPSNTLLLINDKYGKAEIKKNEKVFSQNVPIINSSKYNELVAEDNQNKQLQSNSATIFKKIFYGKFDSNINQYLFEDLHNSFIYNTQRIYGKSYIPDNVHDNFLIKSWSSKVDDLGKKYFKNDNITDFEVYMPIKVKSNFIKFRKGNQFKDKTGSFITQLVVSSFLKQFNPESSAFKQMFQNIFRYSNKMKPVSFKSELILL